MPWSSENTYCVIVKRAKAEYDREEEMREGGREGGSEGESEGGGRERVREEGGRE